METRKVQLSGGTTYTVSLPKAWATENGIDAGSVLSLHPNGDGSLLVEASPDRSKDRRTATVDVSTSGANAVKQRVHALHAVGFDEVTLVDQGGHDADRRQVVGRTVEELSGFELLEVTDTRIRLTNLIDAENVEVRKSALRLRLVTLAMHRDAVTAVVNGDEGLAERVVGRDAEADKLFAMVTRHFRRALTDLHEVEKLDHGRDDLFEYYYTCRQFERIADHAEKIARFALDPDAGLPADFGDRIVSLGKDARQIVDQAADVVLADAGIEAAHLALEHRDDLVADIETLDRELYDHDVPGEAHTAGLLLDSLQRTAEYGANVANISIQQVSRGEVDDR
ncbi:Phosphate uptake regulator [Halomicrobium zhouii]|uniref:Phosphate uptake regulator n=1 Tax=Halomicrobium zhouii TaxID=767519 RepID=A0A1I6KI86_9EURY|nr:PhoU domain-containing protein [Halomicrobium zhouii]SFR90874.1 Phosphate uptake regulator [Halomicrobium zhouii]